VDQAADPPWSHSVSSSERAALCSASPLEEMSVDERCGSGHRQPGQLSRAVAQDIVYTAVELLQAKHEVLHTAAYMILVRTAVDAHMSVRETAARIVEESRGTA
jgi:hypothetical protein